MREPWVDEVLGTGDSMRESFDARLREELSARWTESGDEVVSLEPDDVARDRSPRRWLVVPALAAAVTLAVVAIVVVRNDPAATNDKTVPATRPEPSPVEIDDIAGLTWLVTDVDDQPPESDAPWFRLLPDGRLEGFDGCNRYFGEYELTDSVLTVGDRFSRSVYPCMEASWSGTMLASGAVRLDDDLTVAGRLTRLIDGETKVIELRAIAVESLPASEDSVVGMYIDSGSGQTMELGDGGAVVLKGVERCGEIGRWQIDDGHLAVRITVPDVDAVCRGAAINGRGGVLVGGSILISSDVDGRLREVVTLSPLDDKFDAVGDYNIDLVVPPGGGPPLDPVVFATVPSDAGTDRDPLVAVFPDSVLVLRDVYGVLLGYRYLRSSGEKIQEIVVEVEDPAAVSRAFGSPTGTLYLQLDDCKFAAYVERSGAYEVSDSYEGACDASGDKLVRVTPAGVEVGGEIILRKPGAPQDEATVEVGPGPGVFQDDVPDVAVLQVTRTQGRTYEGLWYAHIEPRAGDQPGYLVTHASPFRGGAAVGLLNGGETPMLLTFPADGQHRSYDLDGWSIAGIDDQGIVFSRPTDDDRGVELARLTS